MRRIKADIVVMVLLTGMVVTGLVSGLPADSADREYYKRIHDTLVYDLKYPETGRKLYFYSTSSLQYSDSFTVVGAEHGERDGYAAYAVIVHDKNSAGHSSFSEERIKKWRERNTDDWVLKRLAGCDTITPVITGKSSWFDSLKGFWVRIVKFQGEYYLDNTWETLIAHELTDSTWLDINMEVHPQLLVSASGRKEYFVLEITGDRMEFDLVDPEREIYKMGGMYLIPVRKVHAFEIIEYINTTGDVIFPLLKFDE